MATSDFRVIGSLSFMAVQASQKYRTHHAYFQSSVTQDLEEKSSFCSYAGKTYNKTSAILIPSSRGQFEAISAKWPKHKKHNTHLYVYIYTRVCVCVYLYMQVKKTSLAYSNGIYKYSTQQWTSLDQRPPQKQDLCLKALLTSVCEYCYSSGMT